MATTERLSWLHDEPPPPAVTVTQPGKGGSMWPWYLLLLLLAWGFLFVNATAFGGGGVMDIPRSVGQLMTQGSLGLALVCALAINRRGLVRPNVFLILLTILAVLAVMVSIHNEFFLGSTTRSVLKAAGCPVFLYH